MLDRILDNPQRDYAVNKLKEAKTSFEATAKLFAKPANPRPFPPLAPLAGNFVNPSFGAAAVALNGDGLVMELQDTGATFKLEPWDGDVFVASLLPIGQFGPIVDLGYMTKLPSLQLEPPRSQPIPVQALTGAVSPLGFSSRQLARAQVPPQGCSPTRSGHRGP